MFPKCNNAHTHRERERDKPIEVYSRILYYFLFFFSFSTPLFFLCHKPHRFVSLFFCVQKKGTCSGTSHWSSSLVLLSQTRVQSEKNQFDCLYLTFVCLYREVCLWIQRQGFPKGLRLSRFFLLCVRKPSISTPPFPVVAQPLHLVCVSWLETPVCQQSRDYNHWSI